MHGHLWLLDTLGRLRAEVVMLAEVLYLHPITMYASQLLLHTDRNSGIGPLEGCWMCWTGALERLVELLGRGGPVGRG